MPSSHTFPFLFHHLPRWIPQTGRQLASLEGKRRRAGRRRRGGGGTLAGAAFIPPSRINHQSLQAANQEKRQSAKRGSGTSPDLFSLQGLFSQIKASHHHFSSLLFLNRSLFSPSVELKMRVIIENLKNSCYSDYMEMAIA